MGSVLVVNNYRGRKRAERLERCVRESGASVTSVDWRESTSRMFDSYDGVVLSGSPEMMSKEKTKERFQREMDAVLDSRTPVLGVCFGHQLIAQAFGAEVVEDTKPVLEMVKTSVLADDPLFMGLPRFLMLLESRHEVVKSLPRGFKLIAKSDTSRIATMRHETRLLYGVQFHPERFTAENPDGDRVLGNYVRMTS